jgi:YidC/Oxa1 family membrane protein insertase
MDKRTIIGLIIIAAILVLTPYYTKFISGEPVDSTEADTLSEAHSDATGADIGRPDSDDKISRHELASTGDTTPSDHSIGDVRQSVAVLDTIPEKKVFVQTGKYTFVLTTKGGDIESIVSSEFVDISDKPMEFCNTEILGSNFEVVGFVGKKAMSSAGLSFVTDRDTLILSETNDEGAVTFVASLPGGGILQRRYHFRFDDYSFDHTTLFAGDSTTDHVDETVLWWRKGLEPSDPRVKTNVSTSYRCGYIMGGEYDSEKFGKSERPRLSHEGNTQFVATLNKYFAVIIAPEEGTASGVRCDGVWYSSDKYDDSNVQVPAIGVGLSRFGGEMPLSRHDLIYIGPRDLKIMKEYSKDFEKTVDLGWRWLAPITKLFIWIFDAMFSILKNYGIVIIVFSILIKLLLYPLSRKQMESMRRMKELEPKLSVLREKYSTDVNKMNEETMKLYKKEKINPLGGCLPLLPQMPIFFALFSMLRNSFALRGAPFTLWLTDLSIKDPYYVLPILMGLTMFIQQKLTIKDPKQKMMVYMMPLLFLFMFRNMPSGLVLYWLCFNVLSLAQTLRVEYQSKRDSQLVRSV